MSTDLVVETVLKTVAELRLWGRARGGRAAAAASSAIRDVGRVIIVIDSIGITSTEDLLAGDGKPASDDGYDLGAFGAAVRLMVDDVEYAGMMPIPALRIRAYLHASKESLYDLGLQAGLKGEALECFKFALYEVSVDLDVNEATGAATIVAVDGKALPT